MKKFVIILLTIISFINFNNSAFASSKYPTTEGAYHGMQKGFGFLVKTRDESVLNPETIRERRRVEGMIIETYNSGHRSSLIQAYNEQVEGFKNNYNEHKKNKDGKEHLSLECLGELRRIKALMISGKK